MFYPTSWTIDHEHNPDKHHKIFESHGPNEPESTFYFAIKHHQNPGDNNSTKKSPLGKNEVGKPLLKVLQNYSVRKICILKLLNSDVRVIVLIGYVSTRTWKVSIYTDQHRFNFSEECRLHSVALQMSWQQASSCNVFRSYWWERAKSNRCYRMWIVGQCIFQRAEF